MLPPPQQQNRITSRMMIQQQLFPPNIPLLLHIHEPPESCCPVWDSVHSMHNRREGDQKGLRKENYAIGRWETIASAASYWVLVKLPLEISFCPRVVVLPDIGVSSAKNDM